MKIKKLKNIIVTTPKGEQETAAQEAQDCIDAKGGHYFRVFKRRPKNIEAGSRIFYVEDGYIRGFATVESVNEDNMKCDTSGKEWGDGCYAIMPANSWQWISPVAMKGFQGYRYFDDSNVEIIGGWLDPKPETQGV